MIHYLEQRQWFDNDVQDMLMVNKVQTDALVTLLTELGDDVSYDDVVLLLNEKCVISSCIDLIALLKKNDIYSLDLFRYCTSKMVQSQSKYNIISPLLEDINDLTDSQVRILADASVSEHYDYMAIAYVLSKLDDSYSGDYQKMIHSDQSWMYGGDNKHYLLQPTGKYKITINDDDLRLICTQPQCYYFTRKILEIVISRPWTAEVVNNYLKNNADSAIDDQAVVSLAKRLLSPTLQCLLNKETTSPFPLPEEVVEHIMLQNKEAAGRLGCTCQFFFQKWVKTEWRLDKLNGTDESRYLPDASATLKNAENNSVP